MRFFEGVIDNYYLSINNYYLNNVKAKIDEAHSYYKDNESPNHKDVLFGAFKEWMRDENILSKKLYVNNLPPRYQTGKLQLCLDGKKVRHYSDIRI